MPLPVDTEKTLLLIPFASVADTLFPEPLYIFSVVRMKQMPPAGPAQFVLRHPDCVQKRLTCISIPAIGVTCPHPVVAVLAHGSVHALAGTQRFLCSLLEGQVQHETD